MIELIKKFILDDYFKYLKLNICFNYDEIIIDNLKLIEQRGTTFMSDQNCEYRYGFKTMKSIEMNDIVKKIQIEIFNKIGIYFDSVLINYYKNGSIGMRYHSDELYDEWYEESVIISFGSTRTITFREINNFDNKINFILENGDLLFMKKNCQSTYQHKLNKSKLDEERISLVFKKKIIK